LVSPLSVKAAGIYMEPKSGTFGPGDTFELDILINVDGDCVNTIDAYLEFPNDYMKVKNFLDGESIINLWLEKPNSLNLAEINETGILNFAGGIPGGYCGRIPGDPGRSNLLGKVIFEIPSFILSDNERETLKLKFLDKTRILLNDGFGTADEVLVEPAEFVFSRQSINASKEWQNEINADTIPPEPFIVELQQKEGIFDGQYYIIFATQDKQSGMDHFQVLEIRPEEEVGKKNERKFWEKWFEEEREAPAWKIAEMPYRLTDQTLTSKIKVMAVDKAGNERVVEYIPQEEAVKKPVSAVMNYGIVILLIIISFVLLLTCVLLVKKIFLKKKYEEDKKAKSL
jgi:hypothetical protein